MDLSNLQEIEEIDGFAVDRNMWENGQRKNQIMIDDVYNIISFKLHSGGAEEKLNGCRVETLLEASLLLLKEMQDKNPKKEYRSAMIGLHDCLDNLSKVHS